MRHAEDDLPPSSLRGRLCEVFFPALLSEMIDSLMRRLGDKAVVDDPIFGAASGLEALRTRLVQWSRFLVDRGAQYDRTITVVGADRDVTEGTLEMASGAVPIALLMERKREREVALRVFVATSPFDSKPQGPTSTDAVATAPSFAADLLAALARKDEKATLGAFEEESSIRDARGVEHARDAASRLLSQSMSVEGIADNGQTCAVEVALGDSRRLALLVFQRGDSGLIRSLRIYTEI